MTRSAPRPRRRGIWVVLAAVTALVVVVPVCVQLWGGALRRTATSTQVYRQPIREVRIDAGAAAVALAPGRAGEVTVDRTLTWALSRPAFRVGTSGDVLTVKFVCDDSTHPFGGLDCGGDLDMRVPAGVRVRAVSDAGEMRMRGLTGDLDLRTASGGVSLDGVRGRVAVTARSGEIRGTGLASPEVTARVASGTLALGFAEPPRSVAATANSGAVRVVVPRGSYYRVVSGMSSGSSHVNQALIDKDATSEITVRSGSGSTWVDYVG